MSLYYKTISCFVGCYYYKENIRLFMAELKKIFEWRGINPFFRVL